MNDWSTSGYGLRRKIARILNEHSNSNDLSDFYLAIGASDTILGPANGMYAAKYSTKEALALAREYMTDEEYIEIMASILGGK